MDVSNTHATNHTKRKLHWKNLELCHLSKKKNIDLQKQDDKGNITAAAKTLLITLCQVLSELGAIWPIEAQ